MYKIQEEIKSRLYYLYKYNNRPNGNTLNETHGVPNIAEYITNQYKEDINRLYWECPKFPYFETVPKDVNCYLCKKIVIYFETNTLGYDGVSAGFLNKSSFNKKDNKYDVIYISCKFQNPKNGIYEILAQIAHEITHAVDNYNRIVNGKEDLFNNLYKKGYSRNNGGTYTIENKIKYILYHTMSAEQNAYIAGIIEKKKPYLLNCDTSEKAYKCLNKSTVYKNILMMESWVDGLKYISEEAKSIVVNYYNMVMKTNITDYNSCYKKILKRWKKFRNKLSINLSKQITDIAMESDKWIYLQPSSSMPLKNDF